LTLASPSLPSADRLRRARESLGLSLDELVFRTKISRGMLEAIEIMNLDRLPVDAYTRGFVLAYAHEVGLEPRSVAADYLADVARRRAALAATAPKPARPAHWRVRLLSDLNSDHSGMTGLIAMLACAAALIVYVWAAGGREPTQSAVTSSPAVESPAEPAPAAADPAKAPGDAVPATSEPSGPAGTGPFRLELEARRNCWVSATVDGKPVLSRLLRRGERETLAASDSIVLRIGEPGALRYSIDGREGRPLGRSGQPVTVRMTRDTLQEFVSS
jgi:cytoskeletal protein RodZ